MNGSESERIAHEAARLYEHGLAQTLSEAIHEAVEHLGLSGIDLPGTGRVRQHLRGLSMQAMGIEAYTEHVKGVINLRGNRIKRIRR